MPKSCTELEETNKFHIRTYAYIGDAVYEVFIREKTINLTSNPAELHKITSAVVKAEFHARIFDKIQDFLNDDEKEIIRRARNLSVTTSRRTNQTLHRISTAFEALVGYLHLSNKNRLKSFFAFIEPFIDEELGTLII
jgi:ribonuclease-3 family protein